jgi:hypothetical protein
MLVRKVVMEIVIVNYFLLRSQFGSTFPRVYSRRIDC